MKHQDFLTMHNKKHIAELPFSIQLDGYKKSEHPCIKCLVRPICNCSYTECEMIMDYIFLYLMKKATARRLKERKANEGKLLSGV